MKMVFTEDQEQRRQSDLEDAVDESEEVVEQLWMDLGLKLVNEARLLEFPVPQQRLSDFIPFDCPLEPVQVLMIGPLRSPHTRRYQLFEVVEEFLSLLFGALRFVSGYPDCLQVLALLLPIVALEKPLTRVDGILHLALFWSFQK